MKNTSNTNRSELPANVSTVLYRGIAVACIGDEVLMETVAQRRVGRFISHRLYCSVSDSGWFEFIGSPTGHHQLAINVTSSERLAAHWAGYVENAKRYCAEKDAA